MESSGYVFSPALASIERTGIVGLLLSDFHTAIIASVSNHESAWGGGGGRIFFFPMSFKSEKICFKQVWMGERKGKGGGGQGLEFMHNVYDATYLHRPTCSILPSIGSCLVWVYVFGGGGGVWCSNK